MPTKWIVAYVCDSLPCNNRTAVIKVLNVTVPPSDLEEDEYDHNGAMRFIIATVLVYSLIGVFGMLLLRIKRSATRSQRTVTIQDETLQKYLRQQDDLAMEGRRYRLKKETEKITQQLKYASLRPKSTASTASYSTGIGGESSFLYSSGLSYSGSEDTLNSMSPRSPHFPLIGYTSRENLRFSLPPLLEGREDPKTDLSSGLREVGVTVHESFPENRKPSDEQTSIDLTAAMPTATEEIAHRHANDVRIARGVNVEDRAQHSDIDSGRTLYEIV